MKGKRVSYTVRELNWIEENRTLSRRALHAAFCKKFGRSDVTLEHVKALCTRRGWKTGRDGRFALEPVS